MPNKAHSKATRLAATFLARLTSADVAAATFRVAPATVRAWQAGGALPDDQWQAIEATLLARGAEMTARGETRGLVQTLTGAGIAARNTRYATLIARREARQQGESDAEQAPSNPLYDALHALRDDQQRLVRDTLDLGLGRNEGAPDPPPRPDGEVEAEMLAWLVQVAAMTPEQVAAEHEAVRAELEALDPPEPPQEPTPPAEPPPADATQPVEAPEPPPPGVISLDDRRTSYDDPNAWQPWRRFDP